MSNFPFDIHILCNERIERIESELALTSKKLEVALEFIKDFQVIYKFVQDGNDSGHYDLLNDNAEQTLKQIEEMK